LRDDVPEPITPMEYSKAQYDEMISDLRKAEKAHEDEIISGNQTGNIYDQAGPSTSFDFIDQVDDTFEQDEPLTSFDFVDEVDDIYVENNFDINFDPELASSEMNFDTSNYINHSECNFDDFENDETEQNFDSSWFAKLSLIEKSFYTFVLSQFYIQAR